jgi:predicted SnoaL-like aldol condensation-catalyzing enzyme
MVDGPTEAVDHQLTETNRAIVRSFVESVLINGESDRLKDYIIKGTYAEHNPRLIDDVSTLEMELQASDNDDRSINYQQIHRVLAEGNFVLCVSEGFSGENHCAFYDLFRIEDGKLAEHWDTTEKIAPQSEWNNDNGKF